MKLSTGQVITIFFFSASFAVLYLCRNIGLFKHRVLTVFNCEINPFSQDLEKVTMILKGIRKQVLERERMQFAYFQECHSICVYLYLHLHLHLHLHLCVITHSTGTDQSEWMPPQVPGFNLLFARLWMAGRERGAQVVQKYFDLLTTGTAILVNTSLIIFF